MSLFKSKSTPFITEKSRYTTHYTSMKTENIFQILLILIIYLTLQPAEGINCYECVHNNQRVKRHNRYVYPCAEFDNSDKYIMKCPDSKLCVYQKINLSLADKQISVSTMDGCTPNTTNQQRYDEVGLVQEGCIRHNSAYKPPSSEYCYCSYNLCNHAAPPNISFSIWAIIPTMYLIARYGFQGPHS
ncbi:unnamed protein product [Meganyctiphanes norvegica]|uniref:Protein quiver n=1 Tax=Meganyctiphanes norvegica TaxID=48144 RepID=A0AAV2QAW2_MEGNR